MNRALLLMSARKSSVLYAATTSSRALHNSSVMSAGGFARDFKPGPYPNSEEERIAAAKKYGLRPQDYKPFPDDGLGFGDYPNLAPITPDMKSDWEDYDDPHLKRNFGEPYLIYQEQLLPEKVTLKPTYAPMSKVIFYFFLVGSVFIGSCLLTWDYQISVPVVPKQYPRNAVNDGEQHYKI